MASNKKIGFLGELSFLGNNCGYRNAQKEAAGSDDPHGRAEGAGARAAAV